MRTGHELINKSALARAIGLTPSAMEAKVRRRDFNKFNTDEIKKLKEVLRELFEYSFELDDPDNFVIYAEFNSFYDRYLTNL